MVRYEKRNIELAINTKRELKEIRDSLKKQHKRFISWDATIQNLLMIRKQVKVKGLKKVDIFDY